MDTRTAPADQPHHRPTTTTPAQKKIINAIHADMGWLTAQDIATATGLSIVYTNRHLAELVEAGIVSRANDGTPTRRKIYSCCGS